MKKLLMEFKEFLKEYKVLGLAVALIIGLAATEFVKAIVDDIIMPLIAPILPNGAWQQYVLALGPFAFKLGHFVSALINFIVIAFVVFLIAKYGFKEEKVSKK